MKNKKAVINQLPTLALGFVILTIVIVVGLLIITRMGDTLVTCPDGNTTVAVLNEAGWINTTGYTLETNDVYGGYTSLVINSIVNTSDDAPILDGNWTVNATGYIINATVAEWSDVKINYTYTWNDVHTWNITTQTCLNDTYEDAQAGEGSGYSSLSYLSTQLGQNGLAGWTPAVIALAIGLLFIGALMFKKGREY